MADDEPQDDPVLAELVALADGDKLDDESVVARATDPDSALHGVFDWHDASAAHQHRLQQARSLIGSYRRQIIVEGGAVTVRRWTKVPSLGRSVPTERAMIDYRGEIEGRAVKELRSWLLRFRGLGPDTITHILTEAGSGL
jgi:hypothetical protein